MLVGIYARISRDDDALSLGVARQERLCRTYARERGWQVVDVYRDNDVSASNYVHRRRPAFERLVADLRSRRFDRILVLAQDRLVRRPEQLEAILQLLATVRGAGIECVLGGPLDAATATGKIHARVKVVFDAAYSDFISERVSLKKRELAERGLPPGGGARPFGYERGGIRVNATEAALVREAADRVIAGQTLYAICSDWNTRRIRSAQGCEWRSGVLRKVLEAPRVAGLREYRGEIVGVAVWPALLDLETYVRVRAAFADVNRRHGGRPPTAAHLLSGLARCGRCDQTLFSNVIKGRRYYVCRNVPTRGGCGRLGIQAPPVEQHVVGLMLSHEADAWSDDDESETMTLILDADRQVLDEIALRRFVFRNITDREYEVTRTALLRRIHDTERRLALCERRERATPQQWAALDHESRRSLLRDRLVSVEVRPGIQGRAYVDLTRVEVKFRV
jgi:DNA invertase Pin-like site-specific DNA recombinase